MHGARRELLELIGKIFYFECYHAGQMVLTRVGEAKISQKEEMKYLSKKMTWLAIVLIFFSGSLFFNIWCAVQWENRAYFIDRDARMAYLVGEMTTTPERQQRALDEIVKDGDGAIVYLIKHIDDTRLLASRDVMFLNTHARSFEKYFHTGGDQVGEIILRYLCWKTRECDSAFDHNDEESVKLQKRKILSYYKNRFLDSRFFGG